MADQPKKVEVTLEMYQEMTDEAKAALPKSQRKKLEKRSQQAKRKAEKAAKEAARLAAAAEKRAAKEAAAESAQGEKQVELDKVRAERLALPLCNDLKHGYSTRTLIKSLLRAPDSGKSLCGKVFEIGGWVRSLRTNGPMTFIVINDGSCRANLQVVCEDPQTEGYAVARKQITGASMLIRGMVTENKGTGNAIELVALTFNVTGTCDESFPMSKKAHSREHLLRNAHLRPRTALIACAARVRNALAFATHCFFQENGFNYVHTPLITASDCEGAGEMFQVTTLLDAGESDVAELQKSGKITAEGKFNYSEDFFSRPAFLTVSGQLSVENYCHALGNVYTFGPTFRAEDSHTSRHLAEFWMIEPEIAFAGLEENMLCAQHYVQYCLRYLLENCEEELEYFNEQDDKVLDRVRLVAKTDFRRLSYTDAVKTLKEHVDAGKVTFENNDIEWGIDLGSEHERYLVEKAFPDEGPVPTIVYNYPKKIKAFYMKANDDGKTVQAMDILVPGVGELVGGSVREDDLGRLDAAIDINNLDRESYWWYRQLRQYGSVPHAGFGLGFERLILFSTGIENIRDVIPFPRYPGHAEF